MGNRSSPVIVGRDEELNRIARALEVAASGRPVLVVIRGEAGIGKSRLVHEAIARARAAGSPILHGACLELDGDGLPYLPLVEALRGLVRDTPPARLTELLGPARSDLAALLPDLAAPGSAGDGAPAARHDSAADRARLFERLLGFLGRLGAETPALAVVEDVHWIDPSTRDLITFLARNVTTERVVTLLTCRTDDLAPGHPVLTWLAEVGRAPGAIRLELDRLGRDDIVRQLDAIEGATVPAEVVDAVWRRSAGHPLFAEELLASASAGDSQPPSLVEILMARVATLDGDTLAIVRAMAVVGRPVGDRLIGRLVTRSAAEVGAALREATARGVLVGLDGGRHGFRHELLREVVEGELSSGERRELHERLARELEADPTLGDDSPAGAAGDLARHWAAAGRPVEAHRAAIAAAAEAEAVHAFADAHRLLERAIGLEPLLPPDAAPDAAARVEVRRRAADAADLDKQLDRAQELLREAIDMVDATAEPVLAGMLRSRLGYLMWSSGDAEGALLEHRQAVALVPEAPPSTERAHVLGALGGALMGLGRWAESKPVCEAAIACAVEIGSAGEEGRARSMLGTDLVALGEVEAGLSEHREAHRLAAGRPELFVVTGHNLGLNLLAADRLEEALDPAAAAREAARDAGMERRFGMDLAALTADILLRLGRWDDAERAVGEGLAIDPRGPGTPYLAAIRGRLLARRGASAAAADVLGAIDRGLLDPDTHVFVVTVAAEAALLAGRADVASAEIAAGLAHLEWNDVFWGMPLVCLGLRAAAEAAEEAIAARDEQRLATIRAAAEPLRAALDGYRRRATTLSGVAWLATGDAELARIDGSTRPEPWAAAIGAWGAGLDPLEAAYARYRFAEAGLRSSGVRADVSAELVAAWRSMAALGCSPLQAQLETLARRARIPLVPGDQPVEVAETEAPAAASARAGAAAAGRAATHGLSAREIEVLRLVAAGRSNGEIAEELFITRKTAGVHVTHILDKMGVSNRVEAAMAGVRLGLVTGEEEADPGERRAP
ncbi:MAG TPA: AAA family ATPase [Candidatus Limnocylindrales bacterium]|nr:AAA family ATPase [Candidatus Limnocylindrales bacterium]